MARDIAEEVKDIFLRSQGIISLNDTYYRASTEPDSWKMKGRVVRLDAAIFAMHLMSARISFRSIPHIIELKLRKTLQIILEQAVKYVGQRIGLKILGKLASVITLIGGVWFDEGVQREVEQAIRRNSIKAMKELYFNPLRQSSGPRATKLVHSRHRTPVQRKANKSWHPRRKH